MPDDPTPKLCECGCGEPAPLAHKTSTFHGTVKGQPLRFKKGHWSRVQPRAVWTDQWRKEDRGFSTPCWIWLGPKDRLGYGRFRSKRLAYRESYERARGPIPKNLELDHLCREPSCVNPDHLEPVTHAENLRRGAGAKLNYEKAEEIRRLRARGLTHCRIAAEFGVCTRTVAEVLAGRRWAVTDQRDVQIGANRD